MTSDHLRQSVLTQARSLVVKMGTQMLTGPDRRLDVSRIAQMAEQVHELRKRGVGVTLVCSGAVGAGMAELGMAERPRDVAEQQAVAAVGQGRLMSHWHDAFKPMGLKVAQVLLTRGDFEHRGRFLNLRNCITQLQALGCIPIINENDTVAVDELRFGDNDMLAALVSNALRADALVLLTVVDGLLDEEGKKIELVQSVDGAMGLTRTDKSALGTGGMGTKLEAVGLVTDAGEVAAIANGREENVLLRLMAAEPLGTVFVPAKRKLDARRRWIGLTRRPTGTVTVDAGAHAALRDHGKSLLAIGITAVEGSFDRGAIVRVRSSGGEELGRGLCNYSAKELRLILGKRSDELEEALGRPAYGEVIHRDNLVVKPV